MAFQNELKRDKNGIIIMPPGCACYGYARVSAQDQNLDRQLDAFKAYGVEDAKIFAEKGASGKNFNRTAYKRLIHILRKGDILVIKAIDRLGRNYTEILEQWRMITQDLGCGIHVLDMPSLNTTGDPDDLISRFITDMMLQVLSFVAQNERESTIKRQKEGIAAAKKRGIIKIGRPKIKIPFDFWEVYILWRSNTVPKGTVCKMCMEEYQMSQRTFYRRMRELDSRYGDIPADRLRDLIVEEDFKDGIAFDMERCEAVIGYYNTYTQDPQHAKELIRKRKEKEPERDPKEEEEELKRIILEKRQKEFQQKFGIKSTKKSKEKDSQLKHTQKGREALKLAEEAMKTRVKTVIID